MAVASDRLERLLGTDPTTLGDELFDTVRAAIYGPLGMDFEVVEADRREYVLGIWDAATGRPAPTGN